MHAAFATVLLFGLIASGCSSDSSPASTAGTNSAADTTGQPQVSVTDPAATTADESWSTEVPPAGRGDAVVYDFPVPPRLLGDPKPSYFSAVVPTAVQASFAAEVGYHNDRWLVIRTELLDEAAAEEFLPRQLQGRNVTVNDVDGVIREDAQGARRLTFGPIAGHRVDMIGRDIDEPTMLAVAETLRIRDAVATVGLLRSAGLHLRHVGPTAYDPQGLSVWYDPRSTGVSYYTDAASVLLTTYDSLGVQFDALMDLTCPTPLEVSIRAGVSGLLCPTAASESGYAYMIWQETDDIAVAIQANVGDDLLVDLAGSTVPRSP